MIILDINLHNRYEQDIPNAEGGAKNFKFFADVICTCCLVSLLQKSSSPRSERSAPPKRLGGRIKLKSGIFSKIWNFY